MTNQCDVEEFAERTLGSYSKVGRKGGSGYSQQQWAGFHVDLT